MMRRWQVQILLGKKNCFSFHLLVAEAAGTWCGGGDGGGGGACIRQHTSAYVSILQHTSAYVSCGGEMAAAEAPAPELSHVQHT